MLFPIPLITHSDEQQVDHCEVIRDDRHIDDRDPDANLNLAISERSSNKDGREQYEQHVSTATFER